MKINTLRAVVAGAALLPAIAFSAEPTAYGQFVTGVGGNLAIGAGGVEGQCPAGFTCTGTPISDGNFLQVQMTRDSDGQGFFYTVVQDNAADSFVAESFVLAGTTNGGIATRQSLNSTGGGVMDAVSVINTGAEFGTATDNTVALEQRITDVPAGFNTGFKYGSSINRTTLLGTSSMSMEQANNITDYNDSFRYEQLADIAADGSQTVTSKAIDMTSNVGLGGADTQGFGYTLREGAAVAASTATVNIGGETPGSINWTGAPSVARVLVDQSMANISTFGYESLSNGTAAQDISTFSLTSVGPFDDIVAASANDPFDPPLTATIGYALLP